jgi:hypothetical protein
MKLDSLVGKKEQTTTIPSTTVAYSNTHSNNLVVDKTFTVDSTGTITIEALTTTVSTTYSNTHSDNLVVDKVIEVNTNLIDEDTTFAELGIEVGDIDFYAEWIDNADNTRTVATIRSLTTESTIGDFINAVDSITAIQARVTLENGVIKIVGYNGFIWGPLAERLGIQILGEDTGNNTDLHNSDSKQLNYVIETLTTVVTEQTATLNWDTTLGELGITTPQDITITPNNKDFNLIGILYSTIWICSIVFAFSEKIFYTKGATFLVDFVSKI